MLDVNLTNGIDAIVGFCTQHVAASVQTNPTPILMVASFIVANLALYGFTRGREFLITGYTAILFLLPFVRLN